MPISPKPTTPPLSQPALLSPNGPDADGKQQSPTATTFRVNLEIDLSSPLRGSPGELYFEARGLSPPHCPESACRWVGVPSPAPRRARNRLKGPGFTRTVQQREITNDQASTGRCGRPGFVDKRGSSAGHTRFRHINNHRDLNPERWFKPPDPTRPPLTDPPSPIPTPRLEPPPADRRSAARDHRMGDACARTWRWSYPAHGG